MSAGPRPGGARRAGPLEAPAKVNLGLRLVGRRPDGYHELESLFVPVSLADRVTLELEPAAAPEVALEVTGPLAHGAPADPGRNLAARAALAFLEAASPDRAGWQVRILLEKHIPAGAGLGGGSSDAGAVLRALARVLPGAVAPGRLREIALGLGADVPFFLDPRPAWVSGIGEQIAPVEGLPSLALLLATPAPPLETAAVYAAYDAAGAALTPPGASRSLRDPSELRDPSGRLRPDRLASLVRNDLEAAACRLHPGIAPLLDALRGAGAVAAALSGSGPTVYGVFETRAEAEAARARLGAGPGLRTWGVEALRGPTA